MNNSFLITIGIPVYNVEKFIDKCLYSALDQDFANYEILIINDYSDDKSIEIIDTIKLSHRKGHIIRVINHTRNLGVSEARNTIIDNAKGKYLYFLDSDDFIEQDTLTKLFNKAEEYDAEATYGSTFILKGNQKSIYKQYSSRIFINKEEFATYFYSNIKTTIQTSVWNILLLTSHLRKHNLRFPKMKVGEDFFFVDRLLDTLKNVVLTEYLTYNYVIRDDSLSNYQSRDQIGIHEVKNALKRTKLLIENCNNSENRPYYPNKCLYVIKQNTYVIFGILKHRHQLTETISNQEIAGALRHPANLKQILMFKRRKIINLVLYFFSKLPVSFIINILTFVGKRKGYITT